MPDNTVDVVVDATTLTIVTTATVDASGTVGPPGPQGAELTVKSNGSQVGDADIVTLDFSSDFTATESPDTEINVSLANTYLQNVVADTTPQLGGNLDAQSNKITSLANATAATDAANWDIADPLFIHHAASGETSIDEFATDTTGDYTAVTPTGAVTWTVHRGAMHAKVSSSVSASDLVGFVKTGTIAVGEHFESRMSVIGGDANFTLAALVIADGTTASSNIYGCLLYGNNTGQFKTLPIGGTFTSYSTHWDGIEDTTVPGVMGLAVRIKRSATNTYGCEWSTVGGDDDNVWVDLGQGTETEAHSFTHVGMAFADFGSGTSRGLGSWHYIRKY